jgi:hypothetical protein
MAYIKTGTEHEHGLSCGRSNKGSASRAPATVEQPMDDSLKFRRAGDRAGTVLSASEAMTLSAACKAATDAQRTAMTDDTNVITLSI